MTREPFMAHSELTNEIYIIVGKEKYCVTEQAIKAVMAIKALEQEPILDKIRAEIERKANSGQWSEAVVYGMKKSIVIIDKYRESEDDEE
jgi:hypothetical protein